MSRSEPLMAEAAGLSTSPIRRRVGVKPIQFSKSADPRHWCVAGSR
jgi:hypothetical protein